jgi:UDP-N-acetylmuramoylalanine--D-glutamate ligase
VSTSVTCPSSMRAADLSGRRVAVWGLAREGRAAIRLLRARHLSASLVLLDDDPQAVPPDECTSGVVCAFGRDQVVRALREVDVVVKSPGISLYRPDVQQAVRSGVRITSLLNLWFAEDRTATTICVTGTKGKSTTSSLIAHILRNLGYGVALAGNIGTPITDVDGSADYVVIEVSSYQAANFDGTCDVGLLTSLFPEHLDWHLTVENYYRDKLNLLARSRTRIVHRSAAGPLAPTVESAGSAASLFDVEAGLHGRGRSILDGEQLVGEVGSPYLARTHNRANLCGALAALRATGIDCEAALAAAADFQALPHRQQELGEVGGVLFVDDSISTIPDSTMAALAVYAGREVTLIVGGHDRGVEYAGLVDHLAGGAVKAAICLGASGERIHSQLQRALVERSGRGCRVYRAGSMADAVELARGVTPAGGVVLLSPAAASYGSYRDFTERGRHFASLAGLGSARPPG